MNYYKDKTILITGGAGAIGRNLTEKISLMEAHKVIILDDLSSSFLWNIPERKNILFVKGDIRNDNDLRRVFHHKPQIVFHLAAFFANQNSVDYPVLNTEINSLGMIKLMEYCVIAGVEKFVYTNSEGGVYGDDCVLPFKEDNISLSLCSPYYVSKLAGEALCYYYNNHYNLKVSILRLFNSYGPGEVPGQYRNVIPNFIYWALKKQCLPLTGNKNISRDFVFVDDTVEGIMRAGFNDKINNLPVNISTGEETKIYDLADIINQKTNNKSGIKIMNQRKWDKRERIIGSNERCKQLLDFKPVTKIDDGIDSTIKWFEQNWENIDKSAEFMPGINTALDV